LIYVCFYVCLIHYFSIIYSRLLNPNFPVKLLSHPAISNRIDPLIPLCPYQLNGRCADRQCPYQHEEEYLLSEREIVEAILGLWPKLCPRGTTPGAFSDFVEIFYPKNFEPLHSLSKQKVRFVFPKCGLYRRVRSPFFDGADRGRVEMASTQYPNEAISVHLFAKQVSPLQGPFCIFLLAG